MKNKLTFSLLFVFIIGLTNAVNIAMGGILFDKFSMQTKTFFDNLELWRLFTLSIFTNSIENFALFLFAFLFLSNKIENFLGSRIYPIFIVLITFLTGTLSTVFMVKEDVIFGGLEGTSFFVISFFIFLNRNNFIRENNLSLRLGIITIFVFWFGIKSYIGMEYGFINIVPSFIMALCGIIIGALMFFQINYLLKKKMKNIRAKTKNQKTIQTANFVGYSIYNNPKFKKLFYDKIEQNYFLIKEKLDRQKEEEFVENILTDEEKLDQILDKINLIGQSNLTKEELAFLNYYSNKLQ